MVGQQTKNIKYSFSSLSLRIYCPQNSFSKIFKVIEKSNFDQTIIYQIEMENVWEELREKLPYTTSPEDVKKRGKIWSSFDGNGNGYLSLAQLDKGVRDVLQLPNLFNIKPVLIRAYNSAKDKIKSKGKSKQGDDYVSKGQFRFFLKYLRQYYEYWVAFDKIDTDDDRKITLEEFVQAVSTMEKWGLKFSDPKKAFEQADNNGGGVLLFDEFCAWAIKKNLDLDNDDDAL